MFQFSFAENKIDVESLQYLDESQIQQLIPELGPRSILIGKLKRKSNLITNESNSVSTYMYM